MEKIAMYLRKSRADLEAEQRGEGETLTKHKNALLKVAKQQKLNIVKIYEEIVSGESLMHRPQMLALLKAVENKEYNAVLVMDMDRLGRGKMQEQGMILETFQEARTKIITPRKTYDLTDEFDEEYSEFEAFMARKELKIINRRLQGGRIRSVEDGNYIATRPPYGYVIKHLDDGGRTLEAHPEQAAIVKMIFEWYTHDDPKQRIATSRIANRLNEYGYLTYTCKQWQSSSVLNIIKNAVYAGRVQWKKKEHKKSDVPGQQLVKTRPRDEWICVEGKHERLISKELYEKAQSILKNRYHVPYQLNNKIVNPLAGLLRCDKCGSSLVLRPYTNQPSHIRCHNSLCDNRSTRFEHVERHFIVGLHDWLEQLKADWTIQDTESNEDHENKNELRKNALASLENELNELNKQKNRLHDLLERGIYAEETYLERSTLIAQRINEVENSIKTIESELTNEESINKAQEEVIPAVEKVIDLYYKTKDPAQQNALLKTVIEKAVYRKEKNQRNDDFTLVLYPKLNPNR